MEFTEKQEIFLDFLEKSLGVISLALQKSEVSREEYESWLLNAGSCLWEPPVAMPTDGQMYAWDEDTTSWIAQNG